MKLFSFGVLLGMAYAAYAADDNNCYRQSFGADSFVCVCDVEHCDFMFDILRPEPGFFATYKTDRDAARFWRNEGLEEEEDLGNTTIVIDHARSYQRIEGFGGAFTDSAGINIVSLGPELQEKVLRSYFGSEGIDYRVCRIPIAGTDFSTRPYTYDDIDGDVDLEFFELQEEDYLYKLPLITRALELARHQIRLFGSSWAVPSWMKENGTADGTSCLSPGMEDPFAQYLIKFISEYERNNVSIWGLTPQNEPMLALTFEDWPLITCAFTAEDMRDFIRDNLGPALRNAQLGGVRLMIVDDTRKALPQYAAVTLEDPEASRYVSGIAVHWYEDDSVGPEVLIETQELFPNQFILYTESCEGFDAPENERVILGSWQRAENYAANIIEDMNAHVTGWVDWNIALDMQGGPNWKNNFVDAPIITDAENGVFYRQPTYYALGHFSKFLLQGADRVYSNVEGDGVDVIKAAVFHDPNGESVAVLLNTSEEPQSVSIKAHTGLYINIEMTQKSIETVLFD